MLIDNSLLLDTAHALTATAVSTNVVDLGVKRDLGIGPNNVAPRIMCLVTTALTSTNSATLTVQAQGSTDNSTFTTYAESRAYTAGELIAGNRLLDIDLPRPSGGAANPRYLRLNYVVGTGVFSAGAVTAAIDRKSVV